MRKKKILFYDSRKSVSTKKIFAVQVFFFFLVFIIVFFFFCGLVLTDFTDFEFSLIVLSKLIHTNILVGNV